jgi:hypothetical protein
MPTLYKTPGVFIEELAAAGPIEAVGTSTAAFVGPALAGPMNKPVKITNWTQFITQFGILAVTDGQVELSPYSTYPRQLYMPYAVRGFFENGGTTCYVVRVGTGVRAFLDLEDRADEPATAPPLPTQAPPCTSRPKKKAQPGTLSPSRWRMIAWARPRSPALAPTSAPPRKADCR